MEPRSAHHLAMCKQCRFNVVCAHGHAFVSCFPTHAHSGGQGEAEGAPHALAFSLVPQGPEPTYIFRRLGNFLKIPVASRTDISLSFSRLHGKQAGEVGTSFAALHWAPPLRDPHGFG